MIHGFLRERFASGKPRVILELGAHDGTDTRRLAALPGVVVHAWEPDAGNALVDLPNVISNRCAVGAQNGSQAWFPSRARDGRPWTCSGSLRRPTGHLSAYPGVSFGVTGTTPVVTLDTYCAEHGLDVIDCIWADVQGAERDVLAGGRATLARTRYLYTEYADRELYAGQPTLAEIEALLPGWRLVWKRPEEAYGNALFENIRLTTLHAPNLSLLITGVCNRICPHCHNRIPQGDTFPRSHGTWDEFREVAAKVRPLDTLYLCGGEPTLHPLFRDMAPFWREQFQATTIILVSNGFLVPEYRDTWQYFDDIWITDYPDDPKSQAATAALTAAGRRFTRASAAHSPLRPSGGTNPCGRIDTATYGNGRLWGCTVAPGLPGSRSIPLTADWREELAVVRPSCAVCPFALEAVA